MNILIVDDAPTNLKLLRAQLESEGHAVLAAANGVEALEVLEREPVDAVISDILMPKMDGYRLCHEMRRRERFQLLPFIFYSATYTSPADEKLGRDLGADKFLKKPAAARELLDALGEVTREARYQRPRPIAPHDERDVVEQYSSRLVEKLEQKNLGLAAANAELLQTRGQLTLLATALETAANSVIITDARGVIVWVNPSFTTVTGYPAEEALGRTPRILKSGRHDERFYQEFWRAITAGQTWRGEFINRRKDGSLFHSEHTVTPFRSEEGRIIHYIGILQDVTRRVRGEEELRQAHDEMRLLLAHSPAVIYRLKLEKDAIIPVAISDNITRLLGFEVEETMSLEWWLQQLHPEDAVRAQAGLRETIEKGSSRTEYRVRHKAGGYRWVEDNRRSIPDDSGRPVELTGVWTDVTERKAADDQLMESERRFREMLENVQMIAISLDQNGVVTFCNDYLLQLTGWKKEEVIGADWFERFIPATLPEFQKIFLERIQTSDVPMHYQNPIRTKEGSIREILWNNTMLRSSGGGILGVASLGEDVTERLRDEARLKEQAALLNAANEAIYVRDLDDVINYWNKGAERIYGWTAEEVLGRKSGEVLRDDPAAVKDALGRLMTTGEWRGEMIRRAKDGRKLTIEVSWTLVRDAAGEPARILAINSDITEKKKLEAQFLRAQRLESIGTLAGGIAHDLNNVLAPILMSIAIIKEMVEKDEDQMLIETLERSAARGAELVKQVLGFARGVEGERISINPLYVLREIQNLVRDTFPKSVVFELKAPREPWTVTGDPTQLHQVFMNLCVNARDAMPAGGRIEIELENVMFDDVYAAMHPGCAPGPYALVKVSDTGTGIPDEIMDKIFDPFFTTKEIGKGTGLGLSTTMSIVRSHHGLIRAASEPGRGAKFEVYLPATLSASLPGGAPAAPCVLPRGNGETLLVVDDEANIRHAAKEVLERFGYLVLVAANGAEAVGIYARERERIALVLTDMAMPIMDGPALIVALKSINPRVRILASTGLDSDGDGDKAIALGVPVMHKPYTAEMILNALRKALA